ncbi:MAG: hypothetical protein EOO11_08765 [Chitinophagaceae bacterium]|nr:MAG: hypothetical protein EOO11_08765 [Chitinophagaceae bacterium]
MPAPCLRACAVAACLAAAGPVAAQAPALAPTRSAAGVVLSKTTMQPLPGATITSRQRGTVVQADGEGRFFLQSRGGDTLLLTHVGYEELRLAVPAEAAGGAWTSMAALPQSAGLLPGVAVHERPTALQFRRDFLKAAVPPDSLRTATRGLAPADLKALRHSTPPSGSESVGALMAAQASAATHKGQLAPVPGLNLFTWLKPKKKKKQLRAVF